MYIHVPSMLPMIAGFRLKLNTIKFILCWPTEFLVGKWSMGPREGAVGCIWLSSDFAEPRWREALIVGFGCKPWFRHLRKRWRTVDCPAAQWVTIVQLPRRSKDISSEDGTSRRRRLKILELDADRKDLLKRGQSLLGSDEDLAYATASEPPALSKKQRGKREEDSSDSESFNSPQRDTDGMEDWVAKMKKNWLGSGTGTGGTKPKDRSRERDRSKRFALIERGRDKKEDESSGLKEADIMKLVSGTKDLLHGLLALQLAQNLSRSQKKKKTKKNRHRRSTSSSASGSTSESSSSSSETGSCSRTRGRAKAISDLQATKRKMFRRPLKYMKR